MQSVLSEISPPPGALQSFYILLFHELLAQHSHLSEESQFKHAAPRKVMLFYSSPVVFKKPETMKNKRSDGVDYVASK